MSDILMILLRCAAVYLFVVFAIRMFGKKEFAQLSVVDLVFILLISNSVQNAMVGGNTSLIGGLVAVTTLFTVNYVFKYLFFRSKKLSTLLQGTPLMLIYRGTLIKEHLNKAKITLEELEATVREHGVEDISQVDLAVLEIDGNISVLSQNFVRKTVKQRNAHKIISKTS